MPEALFGRGPRRAPPFDLAEVVERAVHWVAKATGSQFEVRIDLPAGIEVAGSPGQLQQVVMNLVQNAADATEKSRERRLEIAVASAKAASDHRVPRQRPGHRRREPGPDVRSLLHHQAGGHAAPGWAWRSATASSSATAAN
jgi:nitrogen-specific signal transduction histidine kinase